MLVLRRRPHEVIVFEGGLTVTLLDLADHKAWLGFEAPSIDGIIALSPLGVTNGTASVGIRSPLALRREDGDFFVQLDAQQSTTDQPAMLVLYPGIDESVHFDGMNLSISSIANERFGLEIELPCLGQPVTISVQSVSGIEARIGIEAPDDLRVMRKELWLDLVDANTTAAQWSSDEMASLRTPSAATANAVGTTEIPSTADLSR